MLQFRVLQRPHASDRFLDLGESETCGGVDDILFNSGFYHHIVLFDYGCHHHITLVNMDFHCIHDIMPAGGSDYCVRVTGWNLRMQALHGCSALRTLLLVQRGRGSFISDHYNHPCVRTLQKLLQ